jgi:hypothetical protein
MAVPTSLVVTYASAFTAGVPSAQATYTYSLPKPDNASPIDYTVGVRNIQKSGGLWIGQQFVPWEQILSIVAQ